MTEARPPQTPSRTFSADARQYWSGWLDADALATVKKGIYYTTLVAPGHRIMALNTQAVRSDYIRRSLVWRGSLSRGRIDEGPRETFTSPLRRETRSTSTGSSAAQTSRTRPSGSCRHFRPPRKLARKSGSSAVSAMSFFSHVSFSLSLVSTSSLFFRIPPISLSFRRRMTAVMAQIVD